MDKPQFTADDVLTFSVDVTNTGSMAGKESVLLYSKDLVASSTPDNIRLRNFEKISLNPGETKTVTAMDLGERRFQSEVRRPMD